MLAAFLKLGSNNTIIAEGWLLASDYQVYIVWV